jgi:hypothetical protein
MQRTFYSVRWAPKGIVKRKGNEPAARMMSRSCLSSHYLLSIAAMAHEIRLLSVVAVGTTTLMGRLPDVSTIMVVVVRVCRRMVSVSRNVCRWLMVASRVWVVEHSPVKSGTATSSTQMLRSVNSRVWGRWRSVMRCGIVRGYPSSVGVVHVVETRLWAFQRGSLVITAVRLTVWASSLNVGINRGKRSCSETVKSGLVLDFLRRAPLLPVHKPSFEVAALIKIHVQIPAHSLQPLMLQCVQLRNWDPTDLRP